jgi:hypothetical protein
MTAFDPTKNRGEQSNKAKYENGNMPAGDYLLVGKWLTVKTAKTTGTDYTNMVIEVLEGPARGVGFFQYQGLDLTKDGVVRRLGWMCQAMGVDYEFDPNNIAHLAGALLLRPFKAYVSRKRDRRTGDWKNEIGRFYLPKATGEVDAKEVHLLAEHREKFEDWKLNYKDERGSSGSYRDDSYADDAPPAPPPHSDDDFGGTPRQQDFADDDLPFR